MAVNKVVINNETLLDLTADTATAATVLSGRTFHTAAGELATGTLRAASQPRNLLLNSDFTDRDSVVDQRQGYVVAAGTTCSSPFSGSVTVDAYTPAYYVSFSGTKAFFRLSADSSAALYNASASQVTRGYAGTDYGVDLLRGFAAADHYLVESDGLFFPGDTANNGVFKPVPDFAALSGRQLTLSVFFPVVTGSVTVAHASVSPSAETVLGTVTESGAHTFTFTAPDLSGRSDFGIRIYATGDTTTSYKLGGLCLCEGENQNGFSQDSSGNWRPAWVQRYEDELLRCQRYFQVFRTEGLRPAYAADCRPTMAKDPTRSAVLIGSTTYYANSAEP